MLFQIDLMGINYGRGGKAILFRNVIPTSNKYGSTHLLVHPDSHNALSV